MSASYYVYRGTGRDTLTEGVDLSEWEVELAELSRRPLAPCGTAAAARRHWRRGEPVDEACRIAANVDKQERTAQGGAS